MEHPVEFQPIQLDTNTSPSFNQKSPNPVKKVELREDSDKKLEPPSISANSPHDALKQLDISPRVKKERQKSKSIDRIEIMSADDSISLISKEDDEIFPKV